MEPPFPMRRPACHLVRQLSIIGALGAIALSLAAGFVGVDADGRWGPFRIGLLLAGSLWLAGVAGARLVNALDDRILRSRSRSRGEARLADRPIFDGNTDRGMTVADPLEIASDGGPAGNQAGVQASTARQIRQRLGRLAALAVFFLAVELIYVWYASASLMVTWPETTRRYAMLADSFLQGRADLLIDPPPELAELENPYDPEQREGIDFLSDASYYRGRYYAYWGPAPAVFSMIHRILFDRTLGDEYLSFLGASLALLFTVLVILRLWRLHYRGAPRWLLGAALVVAAVAHPVLWNLSSPEVYETAIAVGQAFLLGGLFFALPAIEGSRGERTNLVLAGTSWGIAIASRINLAPAVLVFLAAALLGLWEVKNRAGILRSVVADIAFLGVSFSLVIAMLALYNHSRFGSALETGFRFTLVPDQDHIQLLQRGELFNAAYLPSNLLYYSFGPVRAKEVFPFLKSVRGTLPSYTMFLESFPTPDAYSVEEVTGIALAAPFAIFSAVLAARLACANGNREAMSTGTPRVRRGVARVGTGLLLAGALTFAPLLVYRFAANRFLFDLVPMVILASVLGAWDLAVTTRARPIGNKIVSFFVLSTAIGTLVVSMLIAVSGRASRIDDYNPDLWRVLTGFRLW